MTAAGLDVEQATVRFGLSVALDSLDVAVDPGEIVAIVGPSGCGKSTLLRVIAGLQPLDLGTVRWAGNDLAGVAPHRRDIGLMFQDHALFEHRSVGDNVGFGLKMRGDRPADRSRRVGELLEVVGLAGFEDREVGSLSGGEAQRVALARALAPEPRVLLLDEPLGSLDRARRDQLVGEIRSVLREIGQTALHVTHDQDEAFAVADRVAVMQGGRIERIGTPAALWSDPQTSFVAAFLGHNVTETSAGPISVPADAYRLVTAASAVQPQLVGTVADVRFRGDRFDVVVESAAGDKIRVRVAGVDDLAIGSTVGVEVDPERVASVRRSGTDPAT